MAKAKPLSYAQHRDLAALAKPGSYQEGFGCTNRTMGNLEARGYVKFAWENPLRFSAGKWEITQAGRDALAAT